MSGQLFPALALSLVLAGSTVHAATLAVPGDHPTVAEALAAARQGDRIEISPGNYPEFDLALPEGVIVVGMGAVPDEVVLDARGLGRVFLAESIGQASTLRNLTLTGGRAEGPTSYDQSGGALLVNNSYLQVQWCLFLDNSAEAHGGAIRATNSTLIITETRFRANTAPDGGGGAIDCSYGTSPLVKNCRFELNQASWGGAISCRANSSPQVVDSFFQDNQALGARGFGGAVFTDSEALPVFSRSTFHRNKARYGGALACFQDSETNLQNCTLVANESEVEGGGLFTNDASPRISCSIIAYQIGTGISAQGASLPQVSSTDVFGNSGGDWTGAIASLANVEGNLSADPLFCHPDPGPGQGFTVAPESPVVTGGECGVLGAWPADCIITPVTLGNFEADWYDGQARLSWRVGTPDLAPTFLLTGTSTREPDREWVVDYFNDGTGSFIGFDPMVQRDSGDVYRFRLYVPDDLGGWSLLGETLLDATPGFPGIRALTTSPNPFNPMTTISFELGRAQNTRVAVYALDGRRLRVLDEGPRPAGLQQIVWDGRDHTGRTVASGPYLVMVEGENQVQRLKVTLLK
jgi:predicted outer membrane repeat protein